MMTDHHTHVYPSSHIFLCFLQIFGLLFISSVNAVQHRMYVCLWLYNWQAEWNYSKGNGLGRISGKRRPCWAWLKLCWFFNAATPTVLFYTRVKHWPLATCHCIQLHPNFLICFEEMCMFVWGNVEESIQNIDQNVLILLIFAQGNYTSRQKWQVY